MKVYFVEYYAQGAWYPCVEHGLTREQARKKRRGMSDANWAKLRIAIYVRQERAKSKGGKRAGK